MTNLSIFLLSKDYFVHLPSLSFHFKLLVEATVATLQDYDGFIVCSIH